MAESARQVLPAAAKPVNTRPAASPAYECTKSDESSAIVPTTRNTNSAGLRSQRGSQQKANTDATKPAPQYHALIRPARASLKP